MPLATARASIASCSDGSDEMSQKGWLAKRSVYLTLDALLLSYTISLTDTHLYLAVHDPQHANERSVSSRRQQAQAQTHRCKDKHIDAIY